MTSATGAAKSGPSTPRTHARVITMTGVITKSLIIDIDNDIIGFPIDCRKMLVALITQQRIIVLK